MRRFSVANSYSTASLGGSDPQAVLIARREAIARSKPVPLIPPQLAERVCAFLKRPNPLLFAGAGVGCRVGLPTWDAYVESLAAACEQAGDPTAATLIRERLSRRNHLQAATVFKSLDSLPVGEMWRALAGPFRVAIADVELDKLEPLVGLGFTAIVTTNYDSSLLDASARFRRRWVPPLQRGTLSGQSLNRDYFVARIHGVAEQPDSMVVDLNDYSRLREEDDYLDFLIDILRTRSCLFVGFSFIDPAINHILSIYEEKCGPVFSNLHTALIPEGQHELRNRLSRLNIESLEYFSSEQHADVWRALRLAFESCTTDDPHRGALPPPVPVHGSVHKFVAFAYAQVRSRTAALPLLMDVQDGLISSLVAERSSETVTRGSLVTAAARALGVSEATASDIVDQSWRRLVERDQILVDGDEAIWCGALELPFTQHLDHLAQGTIHRMRVREGIRVVDSDRAVAASALERIFMARAWDIAAHYAGAGVGWTGDLHTIIRQVLQDGMATGRRPSAPDAMGRALTALLTAPDSEEAELIAALGRAAFGVQLLMSSPRQSLHHKYSLPERIYLDTNVVMPAITSGHPLRPVYADVLARLGGAAKSAGIELQVIVGTQFLNEIVSHRRLAIQIVLDIGLEDWNRLASHIQFRGAVNTNVFVGAYATVVGRAQKKLSFTDFLSQVAPYDSEAQLEEYLERRGIRSQVMDFREAHNAEFVRVFNPLVNAYESSEDELLRGKDAVLVRHEAQQLTRLFLDSRAGVRSLFVTADARLRRTLLMHPALRPLASLSVSQLGLVAITDVLIGLETDPRSFARLIWAIPSSDEQRSLFDYFISQGLARYSEGLGMELQTVAEETARHAKEAAEREGVDIFSSDPADVAKTAAFLDRFQDRFYQSWSAAVSKHEQQTRSRAT